jgi:hypothetical protein
MAPGPRRRPVHYARQDHHARAAGYIDPTGTLAREDLLAQERPGISD